MQGQDAIGRMATVVQEALTGIRVVKAFGGQALAGAKFQGPVTDAREYHTAATKKSSTLELLLPSVEGLLADPHLATDLSNRSPLLRLAQAEGDLLGTVSRPLHGMILLFRSGLDHPTRLAL